MSDTDPLTAALRFLARRDHSESELTARLRRKGFSDAETAAALGRCRELGYLDDDRFARRRAKTLLGSGRAVGERLLAELKKYRLDEALIRDAVSEAESEIDRNRLLADLLERRFPGFSYAQADERQRRRVIGYFLRRGFPLGLILTLCHRPEIRPPA